jgi:hypothetical protein
MRSGPDRRRDLRHPTDDVLMLRVNLRSQGR